MMVCRLFLVQKHFHPMICQLFLMVAIRDFLNYPPPMTLLQILCLNFLQLKTEFLPFLV
jgi:hypothetical protein